MVCENCGRTDHRTKSGCKLCKMCHDKKYNPVIKNTETRCKICNKVIFAGEEYCVACKSKIKTKQTKIYICKRVKTCKFRTYIDDEWHCGYLIYTGEKRGCPAECCDKYICGEPIEQRNRKILPSKKADAIYR